MSSEFVHIQGIPVPQGEPLGLRREFSKWSTDPKNDIQVSLFIRALQKFYDTDYKKTLSYFQVAGIHGFPGKRAWDNSEGPSWKGPLLPPEERTKEQQNHMLYCTHNRVTFPTWHRAYMLLFEQTLYNLMGEIIQNELPFGTSDEKQKWEGERKNWRLPYWDWALPANGDSVPALFQTKMISIHAPVAVKSASETVPNPLYRYQLKVDGVLTAMGDLPDDYAVDDILNDAGTAVDFPSSECSGTSRWGITSKPKADWSAGVNNYPAVKTAIHQHGWYTAGDEDGPNADAQTKEIGTHPASDLVNRLMSDSQEPQTWFDFATTASLTNARATSWENWISLEYIHNNFHGFIGGNGHMANVPVAAFDPIFYMHHANIDRLAAIWQAINPEPWWTTIADIPGRSKQPSSDSKLTPFHHEFDSPEKEVRYFNSNDLRYWTQFGYQYDGLQREEGESDTEYSERIKAYVKTTYPSTGRFMRRDHSNLLGDRQDNTYVDYIIDVLYDRYALNGNPYTIHFFLGDVDSSDVASTAILTTHPKHVGSVYNFSTPLDRREAGQPATCESCVQQQDAGILSLAQVPLTVPLYHEAANDANKKINHLGKSEVENYLADELSWIAVSTSGEQIPWERLSKTKVYVLKGKAQHFEEDTILSNYGSYEPLYNVTEGKPAGASHVDYNF